MTRRISLVAVCCSKASVVPVAPEFLEQPHVLDGDHRLIGEGLEQGDLPLGEGPNLGATHHDGPERDALRQ